MGCEKDENRKYNNNILMQWLVYTTSKWNERIDGYLAAC